MPDEPARSFSPHRDAHEHGPAGATPSDQWLELGASIVREALQKAFELGAATLEASSQLQKAALSATSELGVAAINVTSTLFPAGDHLRLEDAPVGILRVDEYLRVIYSTPAAHKLIGEPIQTGTTLDRVLKFERPFLLRERIADSLKQHGRFTTIVELPTKSGDDNLPIPIRVDVEPFGSAGGSRAGLVATLTRLPLSNLPLISEARATLLNVCARYQAPETLLRAVLTKLHEIVPFEIATYYEYAKTTDDEPTTKDPEASPSLRRIRFAFDPQRPDFEWPMGWLSVPKVIDAWTRAPQPFIDDLDFFIAGLPAASADYLRQHPATQIAMREGLKSFCYFPVWEGNAIVSALSFASRTPHRFSPLHWEALSATDLGQVLQLVRSAYRQRFSDRMAKLFQSCAAPLQIARDFVREIAQEFRWDYVGIFRVARVPGHFRLVAQYPEIGELALQPQSFLQPIDKGALSTTFRSGRPIRIADVDSEEGRRAGYIKLGANRSCLCFLISVSGNIEWILDCESTQRGAFAQQDQDGLEILIKNLQAILDLWFEKQVSDALLEQSGQGVVLTGANNRIERMNAKARQLLSLLGSPSQERRLDQYGADAYSSEVLTGKHPVSNLHLRIVGENKLERRVLASSILSDEAFDRWIWLFTDTAEQEWIVGIRYARATVEQVAAQARGPLMLAHALIKRLGAASGEPAMQSATGRQLFSRILKTLAKADLTYERLAQALASRQQIEIGVLLDRFAERLSPEQRATLQLWRPTQTADVRGSPDTLCRALADTFEHLYRLRQPNTAISCSVFSERDHLAIAFAAALTSTPETASESVPDRLVQVEAAARFAAALTKSPEKIAKGPSPIERARWDLLDEGGDLVERILPDGREQLEIRLLPATAAERTANG